VLVAVAVAWGVILLVTGGIDVHIGGWRLRSYGLARPFWLAIAATVSYIAAGGGSSPAAIREWGPALVAFIERRPAWIAGALAVVAVAIGVGYSTRAAVGADAYGYVSQVDLATAHSSPVVIRNEQGEIAGCVAPQPLPDWR